MITVDAEVVQIAKDSGSDSEAEVWSFNRAINEVFRLLPQELCPPPPRERVKPLSGTKHLMKAHATPLLVLPQSKLVENTTKFIQNKLDTDKCSKDWICPQNLVMSLAPTKCYKKVFFDVYFTTLQLVLVPCRGGRTSPRTSS